MLKLIFSPYYDGNCYAGNPEKNGCVLGTKHVGPLGLLNELELRAGLSRGETSPMQRSIAYCNAIHEALNSQAEDPFYKQSFENDPLGVAQLLLRWRDALCMAGWTKDTKLPNSLSADGKKRLEDLQAVEAHFDRIGIGERWQALLAEATAQNILPNDVTIEVDMKMELLPPVIRKVLETIQAKGGKADVSQAVKDLGDKTLKDFAKKLELYQFPEQNDAYQWAALTTNEADVYINEDNFTFNQVLKSVGKPLVGASVQGSVPEMSQLLKLGISLFRNPVNINHLNNYLNLFRHPIQWETRSYLRSKIKSDNGLKHVMDESGRLMSLDNPLFNDQVSSSHLWGMWEVARTSTGNVPEKAVSDFCDALLDWLKKAKQTAAIQVDQDPISGVQLNSQLDLLEKETQSLKAFIHGRKEISNDELDKVVATICQGDSVKTDYARLGSYDMLKDIKGLAVSGKKVMWMDCVLKPRPKHEYSFLNPADIKILQDSGMLIPDASLEMQASDFAERLAVGRAEKIIVLMPQRKDGARTAENLIITELRTDNDNVVINVGKKNKLPAADVKGVAVKGIAPQEVEYSLKNKRLLRNIDKQASQKLKSKKGRGFYNHVIGYQCEHESYSSLTQLINYPFDYVLQYIFDMKDDDSNNISLIEGNVAHKVVSLLVEKATQNAVVDTGKFVGFCRQEPLLKQLINKVIQSSGAILLLPENQMEKESFIRILSENSIPTLAQIIKDNHLEVVGSEVEYTRILKDVKGNPIFNLNSTIDLVLKKVQDGQPTKYYIFDFKWTTKPNTRKKELEGCRELQLALYEKILEEVYDSGCVEMYGYYMLKQTKLLTTYTYLLPNAAIEVLQQNSGNNLFEQAAESYRERIRNLKDGFIEEGEDMPGPDFVKTQFIDACLSDYLAHHPIKNFYLNNELVMSTKNLGQMNSTKKKVAYKYAVLKNRIK